MNPVVKAQMSKFFQTNPGVKLEEPSLFEIFSIHAILNGLRSESIDPFAAHLSGDEFGIDGIALLIQGSLCQTVDDVAECLSHGKNHEIEFCFFQSKTGNKIEYGELTKFFDGVTDFFEGTYLDPTAQLEELMDAQGAIFKEAFKQNPKLRLFYATTGTAELSKQNKKLIADKRAKLSNLNIFESIQFSPIGAKSLQDGYRSATNSNSRDIEIIKPLTLPEHPSVQQSFIGYVKAEELVKIATQDAAEETERRINRAVFFDNVRDFNEKSDINKDILQELKVGGQQSFVFKNNGVTVVAKDVSRKGDTFYLDDYQIVNGCQTCNILFQAGESAKDAFVPLRLIVSDDAEFVSKIIVGTNRQNEVKEDQFWALTSFMKDLEEYSNQQPADQKLFIERREHQYRNEGIERTRIVKPSELVKAIAGMFLFQPNRAARDYRGIRKEFSSKIFQDDHSVVPYYTAAFASYRIDFAIRNNRVPREYGIYKYYVLSKIGRNFTENKDIFSLKTNKQDAICAKLMTLLSNEEKFIAEFKNTAKILDKLIKSAKLDTREKVRDYIRSESVAEKFFQLTD